MLMAIHAMIFIGEMGGKYTGKDKVWQDWAFGQIKRRGMGLFYFCLNPDSEDTGGILLEDWTRTNGAKLAALADLPGTSVMAMQPPVPPRTPPPQRSPSAPHPPPSRSPPPPSPQVEEGQVPSPPPPSSSDPNQATDPGSIFGTSSTRPSNALFGSSSTHATGPIRLDLAPPPPFIDHSAQDGAPDLSGDAGGSGGMAMAPTLVLLAFVVLAGTGAYVHTTRPGSKLGKGRLNAMALAMALADARDGAPLTVKGLAKKKGKAGATRTREQLEDDDEDEDDEDEDEDARCSSRDTKPSERRSLKATPKTALSMPKTALSMPKTALSMSKTALSMPVSGSNKGAVSAVLGASGKLGSSKGGKVDQGGGGGGGGGGGSGRAQGGQRACNGQRAAAASTSKGANATKKKQPISDDDDGMV